MKGYKKIASLISTDTRSSESLGQFLLRKDVWGLLNHFPLEYWWKTRTSLVVW